MVDEEDSKSFGLITRVGSSPTTGTIIAPKCHASEHFLLPRSKDLNIFRSILLFLVRNVLYIRFCLQIQFFRRFQKKSPTSGRIKVSKPKSKPKEGLFMDIINLELQ